MTDIKNLLDEIRRSNPELSAEDAFSVPAWFPQQDLWIKDPRKSNNAVYNLPLPLRLRGSLNREALRQALREVARRHQVLRSIFRIVDGQLAQIIIPREPVALFATDLSGVIEGERESQVAKFAREEANRPFDLTRESAFRASLVCLDADDHLLLLTTHHLVCDDWSTGILIAELFALYQALSAGEPCPQSRLSFQYADYIRWLWERLQGKELESRLSFWKERLAGLSNFHYSATDRPRPAQRTYLGAIEKAILPEDLANSLRVLSQRQRVSFFITMLAAFQCLLHRYSGHDDIAVGSCAANRPLVEIEGLIGRFANDLIIRTDLSGNPTFRELLHRTRESALTAYSYQDLPFGMLLEELEPRPNSSRNPLFQVMFILQNAPKEKWQIPELTLSWFPLDPGTAKYDLHVWLRIQESLEVTLEYNTDLFEAATIRRMLHQYRTILEEMVRNPEGRVCLLYTSPSPRDLSTSRMPSSA